jgi:hypothetical protein
MERMVRLTQSDIELAIAKALREVGEQAIAGTSVWKLLKGDKPGEKDGLAYVCQVEKLPEGVKNHDKAID